MNLRHFLLVGWAIVAAGAMASPLPPYNHYLPPVLDQYATQADHTDHQATARILRARAERLKGNSSSATAADPAKPTPSILAAKHPLVINPAHVPALWQTLSPAAKAKP